MPIAFPIEILTCMSWNQVAKLSGGEHEGVRLHADMAARVEAAQLLDKSCRVIFCKADGGCGCAQAGVADITAALRNYRPSQTVLEAEMAAPRRGGGSAAGPLSGADESRANVMRQKRRRHDITIDVSLLSKVLHMCSHARVAQHAHSVHVLSWTDNDIAQHRRGILDGHCWASGAASSTLHDHRAP